MALTCTTAVDLVGQTQTLNYYTGATLIDSISYSGGVITFSSESSFNLSKSDTVLYNSFFQIFFTLLVLNFPSVNVSNNFPFPLCNFQISETSQGVTHINYNQTSAGNSVYGINYVPIAASAAFAARSAVTISTQEFVMLRIMLDNYFNQVRLN